LNAGFERSMDVLDGYLMDGSLTQLDYDAAVRQLNVWAEAQYSRMPGKAVDD
jgi:hypothetical protein